MSVFSASNQACEECFEEFVARILAYDAASGDFSWKESRNGRALKGGVAGSLNQDGYIAIRIDGIAYLAHRLAFLFMTGAMPTDHVDHINGERADNRWKNLRAVSREVNAQNQRRAAKRNKSGRLGVILTDSGRFRAQIASRGQTYSLGTFSCPDAAHRAYVDAKRVLHEGGTL